MRSTRGPVILVDLGPEEAGEQVSDYLRSLGIYTMDTLINTHPYENHFGGFKPLSQTIYVRQVLFNGSQKGEEGYAEFLSFLDRANIPPRFIRPNRYQ